MKKIALVTAAAASVLLLGGAAVVNAQNRDPPHAAVPHSEGMHRGDGSHNGDVDRDHRDHHRHVVVVGVPFFWGPGYDGYYPAPPAEAYRSLDGFYYYCLEAAGYYPAVEACPSGWRLIP